MRNIVVIFAVLVAKPVLAAGPFTFSSIDGGKISSVTWAGHPVLVVNTASMCGFTPQYADLQALQDKYAAQGLIVLAIPSDDFRQELGSAKEVKAYCDLNYNLTLPMTDISHVTGAEAVPFYQWVKAETGFEPGWNFNKILIGPDGAILGTFGSAVSPTSVRITQPIESALRQ